MKYVLIPLLSASMFFLYSCGSTDATDDGQDDPPVQTTTYSLTTSVTPEEAGSINPSSGVFDEMTVVSIEATAESGFAFREWDGDAGGSDNPLAVTMNSDKNITAHFDDLRSEYSVFITLSDQTDELMLEFGQSESPGDSLRSAPPAPPEGAMHAWFSADGEELFADYRDRTETDTEWELRFQPSEAETYILSWWYINIIRMDGTLTLQSDFLDDDIDMQETDSVQFSTTQTGEFRIIYVREE